MLQQGPSTVGPSLHAQAPQSPSHMLASMGMIPHGQIDPYYYMNAPVFHRQPVSISWKLHPFILADIFLAPISPVHEPFASCLKAASPPTQYPVILYFR